ncbi:hypothetical protein HIM_04675 [Hirsutella minnesotensis 3608]|uniref:Uncharacterized protein n=1 Tax=Hirsutella minnesotensis 3608 TaxID=1043627 RepID=A0A0F7ZL07_9HYPO|nr:hypothetical protein HIM_04675 [Hirsutella minnesotensis 3608]
METRPPPEQPDSQSVEDVDDLSLYQRARRYPRSHIIVEPLLWTKLQLDLLQCTLPALVLHRPSSWSLIILRTRACVEPLPWPSGIAGFEIAPMLCAIYSPHMTAPLMSM